MKIFKIALIALSLFISAAQAAEGKAGENKASEESIRQLMQVTEARKLVDQMYRRIDSMMLAEIQKTFQSTDVPAKERAFIEKLQAKLFQLFKEEASWEKLEPVYVKIYMENFSQQEIEGMLVFYKSPTGQAMIRKMPLVMQSSIAELQARLQPITQKMSVILQQETAAFLEENRPKETPSKARKGAAPAEPKKDAAAK